MLINDNVQIIGTVVAPQLPTIVEHGTVGNTARPVNAGIVIWVGSATPINKTVSDFWYDHPFVPSDLGGGGGGVSNVFVQNTKPVANGAYLWIQTGPNNTFWIEDGL